MTMELAKRPDLRPSVKLCNLRADPNLGDGTGEFGMTGGARPNGR